ncbi:unnamed protein product, partial [marine sediment metagenome]
MCTATLSLGWHGGSLKKTKLTLLIPVVALLLTAGVAASLTLFFTYEREIVSVPEPMTATVLEDLENKISPFQTSTLRVLLWNEGSENLTIYFS